MNNKGLVEFASMALSEKWGYVWGTFGQKLDVALLTQKARQYPGEVGAKVEFISKTWMGRRVSDCVGLIKSYFWTQNGVVKYNAGTDVSANGMFDKATEKGTLDTLPEIPGICLWKRGHIGVYIGGGQVIEARGTYYGVIQSPVRGTGSAGWTHWLKCPYIEYVVETPAPQGEAQPVAPEHKTWQDYIQGDLARDLQIALNAEGIHDDAGNPLEVDGYLGDKSVEAMNKVLIKAPDSGILVRLIQRRLINLGLPLNRYGADGKMSLNGETHKAVKAFQASNDLSQDGVIGKNTMKALFRK